MWLNGDEIIIPREPIDNIHAKIQILSVTEIGVRKKMAASDNDNPLLVVLDGAAERSGDRDRTGYIIHRIEGDTGIELTCLHPSADWTVSACMVEPRRW